MRQSMVLALFAWGVCVVPCQAAWHVWTLAETRHVLREAPAAEGRDVHLAAAGNEWRGFQILVRADEPVAGVNIEPGDLKGPGGAVLRASDARLYRQHQLQIARGTVRNQQFEPGWYPDPLIPFAPPPAELRMADHRFVAAPFDLPADQTHGYWVDLYVPPGSPQGDYRGTYRVTAAHAAPTEIAVTLTVWGFQLPAVPTFRSALGSPADRMRAYYQKRAKQGQAPPLANWDAVETQCAALLSEHRINATPPAAELLPVAQPDGSFRIPPERIAALRQFIDRYHVNAVQVPHPHAAVKDPVAERDRLRAWLAAFDRAAAEIDRPGVDFYTYLKDEPNTAEEYKYVQQWGRAVREAKSVVKVLVVEQTWTQDPVWGDLNGAVDIWCPLFCLHHPDAAAKRQALGESVWTYTALCQGKQPSPWWHIDYPLLNYRAPAWIAWTSQIRGILYWGGMSYWDQTDDPWTDAWTYGRKQGTAGTVYNGEGTLVYPARAVGYEGIVPSLRLKALRDGIEDYEYLAILERRGLRGAAAKVVQPLAESFFKWDQDPVAYDRARLELAKLILASTKP